VEVVGWLFCRGGFAAVPHAGGIGVVAVSGVAVGAGERGLVRRLGAGLWVRAGVVLRVRDCVGRTCFRHGLTVYQNCLRE